MRFLRRFSSALALVSLSCSLVPFSAATAAVAGHLPATPWSSTDAAGSTIPWPQLGVDSGHSGFNPKEKTLNKSNVGRLTLLWQTQTGGEPEGLVFVGDVLYAQGGDGHMYALAPATGKIIWRSSVITLGPQDVPVPAVSDGVVVTECTNGQGGSNQRSGLCGLEASSGKLRWSKLCMTTYCTVEASPTIAGSLAYYEYDDNGGTNYFNAVDVKSGKLAWSVSSPNHCPGNVGGTPVPVANGLAYLTLQCVGQSNNSTEICAFAASNGAPSWCTVPLGDATSGVAAGDGILVANVGDCFGNCENTVQAFDAKSGAAKWTYNTTSQNAFANYTPAIANGIVYDEIYPHGEQALSAQNGSLIWAQTSDSLGGGASIANGIDYLSCSGAVCALNAKNGNILWEAQIGPGTTTTPIVEDGIVYGACAGNSICAWSLPQNLRRRF